MKKRIPTQCIIRFRYWSRKAYAVFASIGRCVTIGNLHKNVADSSLSKQESGSAAGCSKNDLLLVWSEKERSLETDIGIPLEETTNLLVAIGIMPCKWRPIIVCPALHKGNGQIKYSVLKVNQLSLHSAILNKVKNLISDTIQRRDFPASSR